MSKDRKIHLHCSSGHLIASYLTTRGFESIAGRYEKVGSPQWEARLFLENERSVMYLYAPNFPALKQKLRRHITDMVYNKDTDLG